METYNEMLKRVEARVRKLSIMESCFVPLLDKAVIRTEDGLKVFDEEGYHGELNRIFKPIASTMSVELFQDFLNDISNLPLGANDE